MPRKVIQGYTVLASCELSDELRVLFRDEFVGVPRQAQMVRQPAPTILLRVDPLDGRVVRIMLESRLFELFLADRHELAQR